jgi:hypothetical protein
VTEREVVEPLAAISSVVITTSSCSVLPGIAIEPWIMPIRQVGRRRGRRPVRRPPIPERAVRRALRGEDLAVDDASSAARWTEGWSGSRTVITVVAGRRPAIAARS